MAKIELRVPNRVLRKLDMIAYVDDMTRSEVVRTAIREWLDDIDLNWYEKEYEEMKDEEGEDSDSDEDSEDDETVDDSQEDEGEDD